MFAAPVPRRRVLVGAAAGALLLAVAAVGIRTMDADSPSPAGATTSHAPPQTSASGSSTGPTRDPANRRTVRLVAAGDVLIHPAVTDQARRDGARAGGMDFAPMFAGVAPAVRGADLALCHLETPLADPAGPFAGYPSFNAPPQVLDGLRTTGFDGCSTASNHTLDQGADGVARTIRALDAAGRVMARATFTETAPGRWTVTRMEALPTWTDLAPALRLVDLTAALADPGTPPGLRGDYRAAYQRVLGYVRALGAGADQVVASGG
ncbi:CapA family protein [Micromonospora sp. NBC_00617]|uniref:CapA family protein n=1 Tax=Micromonospora sp. NBC_00617 TaxID=2903587 RepID=UPI0030E1201E